MKNTLKKIILLLSVTGLLITCILLTIILNPILLYASKTTHNNFVVYHNETLDPHLLTTLDEAEALCKQSEFYNPNLTLDICLNDGSNYPTLIRALCGRFFARGFYNKVVLQGNMDCKNNVVELSGYKWNLPQLLAHEMTHCLQFDKFGIWKSKPIAAIPNWKWEGYAEYIARQNADQKELAYNIQHFIKNDKHTWEITFADSTITPREYYNYWNLVKYCLDAKKINYEQLLADTTSEQEIIEAMQQWYKSTCK